MVEKLLLLGEKVGADAEIRNLIDASAYEVIRSASRAEGLPVFRTEHPSVVILDRELPDADGIDVLKQLCEEDPTCGTILVTGTEEMEAAIEVLRAGALDYMRSPVDMDALRLALQRADERREQARAVLAPAVLVLDDHEATRTRVARVLSKEGYTVLTASDGEEGLNLIGSKRLDLVLADVRMPKKDGLTVLREAKQLQPDIEVIVVTGYGDEEVVVQALREGANNFIRKPIDIGQTLIAIQKALEFQNTRRSLCYRNRDMMLMRELVVRLTKQLEVVIDAPMNFADNARRFLRELVGALRFGLLVASPDGQIVYSSLDSGVDGGSSDLSADVLASFGVTGVDTDSLSSALDRLAGSEPGTIETLNGSTSGLLVMTPVRLCRAGSTQRLVAMALRGKDQNES